MADETGKLLVNKGELARMFRVSLPTVDNWIGDGLPVEKGGSNGVPYEFDFERVKSWREEKERLASEAEAERQRRIAEQQAELFGGGERLAPEGVSHIKESLEAERLAIIVGQQKGNLIAREDVRADFAAVFGVVRQHMLGWAATLTRSAGLSAEQQKEADRLVRETLIAMHGQIKDPSLRPSLDAV